MTEFKRGREENSGRGAIKSSAWPSKRKLGGEGSKLVFECTFRGKDCSHQRLHETHASRDTHIGAQPYTCTTCGKAFTGYSSLTRHCDTVHALDQESQGG